MRKAFDLRPLDFSDVLGRSFSLFTASFVGYLRWFTILWLLPMLVVAGLLYLALNPFEWVGITREAPSLVKANSYAAYYWLLKLASVVFAFTTGASGVYYLTARVYVGGNPGLGEVARAMGSRFSHVVGAGFLHEMALVGITVVCIAPPFLLWDSGDKGMAVLTGFVGWTAWLPLMLWYISVYALNTPAIMLDDAQAGESFPRSAFLTKRCRTRLMGVTLVTVLVVGAPGIPGLLTIPAIVGRVLLVDAQLPLLAVVIELAWDAVLLPLFFIPLVVYYFDMRCRKESYDLAVMARNFGIEEGEMARYRFNPDLGYMPKGWKGDRARRQKLVRMPQQRAAQRPMPVGPWGPQPGITGGQWAPQQDQPWGPPQQNPQWGPPPQQNPQWGPPQQQDRQWGPPPQNPFYGGPGQGNQ